MAEVYLETSFFSACVTDRDDPASIYRRLRGREWWALQSSQHRLAVSAEVLLELSAPGYRHRDAALAMTAGLVIIPITDEVRGLARALVREQVMPGPESSGDAMHVGVATVHQMDYLL